MLKWILILLKALSVVGAIVSMKRDEGRLAHAHERTKHLTREAIEAVGEARNFAAQAQKASRRAEDWRGRAVTAEAEIPRVQEERDTSYKLVEELKASNGNKRRRIDSQNTRLEWYSDPEKCICTGCRVLRANTHGYAERMRGAIRRDIEAESA